MIIQTKSTRNSFIIIALTACFLFSCKEEADNTVPQVQKKDHAYKGNWHGTFEGDDSGTWEMLADSLGKFQGEMYSNNSKQSYPLTGSIDDNGKFDALIIVGGDTINFDGQGSGGTTASGTWENPVIMIDGTWMGAKDI